MLCVTVKEGESLVIGGIVDVKVYKISTRAVRIAIDAPGEIRITRTASPWMRGNGNTDGENDPSR